MAVLNCVRKVRPARLYVHCDGPRDSVSGEAEKVALVRSVLQEVDWECAVITLFRPQNKGLRAGVSDAITWFFQQEEMGIVLEDDCLPDPSFFPFCESMLIHYRNDAKVMHIAGCNLATQWTNRNIEGYFFSKFIFVWGWASWRRAWEKMSLTLDNLDEFRAKGRMRELSLNKLSTEYLWDKFEATRQNRNNSWAYAWFFSILQSGGISIVPVKNLVQNTGIGESGATHTNSKNDKAAIIAERMDFPIIHPKGKKRIPGLDQQLFYVSQKSRTRLVLWYLLKKLGLR